MSNYQSQFRIQGENIAKNLSYVYFNGDANAIQDSQKHTEFGDHYCMEDKYKFQFRGSEQPVVCQTLFVFILVTSSLFLGKFQGF